MGILKASTERITAYGKYLRKYRTVSCEIWYFKATNCTVYQFHRKIFCQGAKQIRRARDCMTKISVPVTTNHTAKSLLIGETEAKISYILTTASLHLGSFPNTTKHFQVGHGAGKLIRVYYKTAGNFGRCIQTSTSGGLNLNVLTTTRGICVNWLKTYQAVGRNNRPVVAFRCPSIIFDTVLICCYKSNVLLYSFQYMIDWRHCPVQIKWMDNMLLCVCYLRPPRQLD